MAGMYCPCLLLTLLPVFRVVLQFLHVELQCDGNVRRYVIGVCLLWADNGSRSNQASRAEDLLLLRHNAGHGFRVVDSVQCHIL